MGSTKLFAKSAYHFAILLGILAASCHELAEGKKEEIKATTSIEVLYLKGSLETQKSISCNEIKRGIALLVDTLINNKEVYNAIVNQIHRLQTKPNASNKCDVRIKCKVRSEAGNSTELCLDGFDCILQNGMGMKANDTLSYLVRKYSGYYNYFSKEELQYFKELKHFNIPDDYHYLVRADSINGVPLPPE